MSLHPVCPVAELKPGTRKLITLGRIEIGLFNVDGTIHAYRNICPHAGAPVCVGKISGTTLPSPVYEYSYGREGCIIRCPWHGWEFDLKTGEHLVDPEVHLKKFTVEVAPCSNDPEKPENENLEKFPVEIQDGTVFVRLSSPK